ncbi:MAG: hypothetical protein C0506_07215 [Anaerolinea sp.]|nr:hypothetical protein [Anaerolinea sp.]
MAAIAILIAAPVFGITRTIAHDFPKDADGHVHETATVQAWSACGTLLSGADGAGHQVDPATYAYVTPEPLTTQGNSPDHRWVHDTAGLGLAFDLGSARNSVLLFPSIDHPTPAGDVLGEALEATVYGGATAGALTEVGNIRVIYDEGFDAAWISDDHVSLWTFTTAWQYITVVRGGPAAEVDDGDAEIDAVCATTDIQPREINEVIFPGGNVAIQKTVSVASLPPIVDVCLLEDETGSFGDDIANLQTAASAIYDTVVAGSPGAQFAVSGFRDYPTTGGSPGDWVYRNLSPMNAAKPNWLAGVAGLTAGGGDDLPEAQYDAIVAAAGPGSFSDPTLGTQPDCGWRDSSSGAQRVLVVATDATFHVPADAPTYINGSASTITALTAQNIVVVGLKAPGAGGELNSLAAATGGSTQALSSDGSNIGAAILAALSAIEVEVSMESTCTAPISTTFTPNPQTIPSGGQAVFTETISVAANAPGGTYTCRDVARVNGVLLTDANGRVISEVKTIRVPEGFLTGGGFIDTGNGKNAERISWGGNVGYLADFSLVGNWNVQFQNVVGTTYDGAHFKSTSFTVLQFGNVCGPVSNPPPANANSGYFQALGTLNGLPGYKLNVWFADFGEPGKDNDAIRYQLLSSADAVLYDSYNPAGPAGPAPTEGDFADNDERCSPEGLLDADDVHRHQLDGGNLQIHSGVKN